MAGSLLRLVILSRTGLNSGIISIREGVDDLKKYHASFYDYLIKEEFVVDNEVDEVEKVKELSKRVDENEKDFMLTINPTMNCNFKCWYCYETHVKDSKLKENEILKIQRFIDRSISNNSSLERFLLSFFGGEPLLYFNKSVKPLVSHFIDKCRDSKIEPSLGFTSNGYLVNQDFIDFFNEVGF